ncbi:MAG: phosphoglucosamine mutase [Elusimicrobia bacterium RIFOXYB2_FULL_62_6]|nr:MAG: phosphoglucosamine mutase [Elusimicrobia bacterium RIFOXYB2_FULL_62_6]
MGKLFGTDGIRGVPWNYPFTPDFISKIGYASTLVLSKYKRSGPKAPVMLIGRDTRGSGLRIQKALVEGVWANRFKVLDLGVISTPAVAYLVKRENADFGIVISASHNPPEFNGIKYFCRDGLKLNDAVELKIESLLLGAKPLVFKRIKHAIQKKDYSKDYLKFIKSTLPAGFSLKGLKIVADCANGAAYKLAPALLKELGAEVTLLGIRPDGKNINIDCGALHTGAMQKAVTDTGAYCGISFDGDADRCMFSDEKGRLLDGDDLLSIAAPYMQASGRLTGGKAVLTFMSNYGLIRYLAGLGIKAVQVPVGDKNVTDAMRREDLKIGGESSGHIIFREFAPTGDGLLTAVQILAAVRDMGKPFSHFKNLWKRYPQVVGALKVAHKPPLEKVHGFSGKISKFEGVLKGNGRIFIRYSGTEPLLRILVEGESKSVIKGIADDLMEHYKKHAGAVPAGKH